MNTAERNAILSQPNTAVLATVDAKGRAHAVPIWYMWDGEVLGFISLKDSAKTKHIERSGRAALCVEPDGRGSHITAEGPAEVTGPSSLEWRLNLYAHYRGPEEAKKMEVQYDVSQVLITIRPDRWYAWPDPIE